MNGIVECLGKNSTSYEFQLIVVLLVQKACLYKINKNNTGPFCGWINAQGEIESR